MSKTRLIMLILMNIANYILVLFALFLYSFGAPLLYTLMLVSQLNLAIANAFVAKNGNQQAILSVNLVLSTIIAHIVDTKLYMLNISADSETLVVGKAAAVTGCIFVVIVSVIAMVVRHLITRQK